MSERERTDVLIIGGGFGGVNAARRFEKLLKRRLDARVTLVSRTNFYLFTPLLAEVAAALVDSLHAVNPIRRMLRRVEFIQGNVERLNPRQRLAEFVDENGENREIEYRHCVLAPGSITAFFGIDGLERDAFTMKTMGDAIQVRNHVVSLLERAASLPPEQRTALLNFAVVGGGLNGTEVAGELFDFVLRAAEDYPGIQRDEIRFVLVEMMDRLAQELPQQVSHYCQKNLESRGMEVWLNAKVTNYLDGVLNIEDARRLPTETVVWSAGVRPSPLIQDVEAEKVSGDDRLPTNEYLQVRGYEDLWAVGDSAAIPDGQAQKFMPPTAQHAVRQGRHVAENIARALNGEELEPFDYSSKGMLATLGRYRGAGRVFGIPLVGFLAWFAWRTYYLFALPRWERKLRVIIDWTLDFIFPPDIVQIKLERLHPDTRAALGVTPRERQEGESAEGRSETEVSASQT